MTEDNGKVEQDESRRSFMKKGALASSAAAIGLAGSGTVLGETDIQQEVGNGLVFSYDYHPAIPFQVVAGLQQPTVADILGGTEPDQAVVSDPTDYNGYVIRYQTGGGGIYSFVFIQDQALQQGSTYRFTGNVGFFNVQANLVSASMASGSGGDGGNGGNGGGGNMSNPNA